ncbi:hypothetical protein GWI33_009953 [Rhynchophorus ferrugineus]|uniref:Uncharacterized protein n=1 Tax=Rhynchophorus ferrugineus TaxID=354439 RepID=A0A834IVC2_RHYFE|nr:hypothetical protein GWI33_009953 [Rhynchophorus ferrugineus]
MLRGNGNIVKSNAGGKSAAPLFYLTLAVGKLNFGGIRPSAPDLALTARGGIRSTEMGIVQKRRNSMENYLSQ